MEWGIHQGPVGKRVREKQKKKTKGAGPLQQLGHSQLAWPSHGHEGEEKSMQARPRTANRWPRVRMSESDVFIHSTE